ncbi:MAG TPA: potassium transporter Kef [Polyangiaceae bacterium]|nr:potassium transporter Kef [Polyangiaceae bacterium]
MSASELLLGLLVLAYFGGILVGDRTIRGFGLPSGAEYILLGFVVGPRALGLVQSTLIDAFTPIVIVGSAWLALVAGIGYLQVGARRVHLGRALAGVAMSALVGAGIGSAVYFSAALFSSLPHADRLVLAGSAACVSCATTRHAVRWVVERHGAKGKTADAIADYARASVLAPALALALIFGMAPGDGAASLSIPSRVGVTVIVGVVLGLVAALLLGREFRRDESWGILLGTSLLAMGIAGRLGLSAVSTTFFLGLTVALVSPHRSEVKAMTAPTEKPVMLPVALLAGASVHPQGAPYLAALCVVGIVARLIMELLRGALVNLFVPRTRPAGPLLGLGMLTTGAVSLAAAVALELRLRPDLGASVLGYAVASLLVGELLGPILLRRTLLRVGDIIPGMQQTPPPPSVAPPPVRPSSEVR